MTKFIADNWLAIIIVLAVILVGLVVTLVIMDRKDKKLIANYKAEVKALKSTKSAQSVTVEEGVAEDKVEAEGDNAELVDELEDKETSKNTTDKKSK